MEKKNGVNHNTNVLSVCMPAQHTAPARVPTATPSRHRGPSLPSIVSNNNHSSEHHTPLWRLLPPCLVASSPGWEMVGSSRVCQRVLCWANGVFPDSSPGRQCQTTLAGQHCPARSGYHLLPSRSARELVSQDIFSCALLLAFPRSVGELSDFFLNHQDIWFRGVCLPQHHTAPSCARLPCPGPPWCSTRAGNKAGAGEGLLPRAVQLL